MEEGPTTAAEVSAWANVPPGCSTLVGTYATYNAHFNALSTGDNSGTYQRICVSTSLPAAGVMACPKRAGCVSCRSCDDYMHGKVGTCSPRPTCCQPAKVL